MGNGIRRVQTAAYRAIAAEEELRVISDPPRTESTAGDQIEFSCHEPTIAWQQ
jgi:hypothetical protein